MCSRLREELVEKYAKEQGFILFGKVLYNFSRVLGGSREEGAVATADQTREVNRGQTERSLFGLLWKFGFTLKEIPVNRVNQDKCGRIGSREGAFQLQRGEWILRGKTGKGEASWKADVWIERMRNAHEKNKNY